MGAYQLVAVGTDGSDSSYRAVDRAAVVAADAGAALLIISAYHPARNTGQAEQQLGEDAAYHVVGSTPAEEALILRNGMLVGTRGLGHDLSVAEPGTEGLIRAGASGSGTRVMRYFAGDGVERPLQFACTVGAGPRPGVTVESCEGHGTSFQNSYMVGGGQIAVSRQWIGPDLGYVTIQVLRP